MSPVSVCDGLEHLLAPDLGGDGLQDLILHGAQGTVVTVCWNQGNRELGPQELVGDLGAPITQVAADFDADGNTDLALAHVGDESSILPGAGNGNFLEGILFPGLALPGAGGGGSGDGSPEVRRNHLRVVDLDLDGLPDLVRTLPEWNRISLLRNMTERALADEDQDGVLDVCEGKESQPFVRGDVNADGTITITDAITVLRHLFLGEGAPSCERAADLDDEGQITLTDGVRILRFLFLGDSAPSAPWPECGLDLTVDPLSCESFAPCGAPPR